MNGKRFVSLDMQGRLVIDLQGAIKAGVFADELEAARRLSRALRRELAANDDPRWAITEAGRKALLPDDGA